MSKKPYNVRVDESKIEKLNEIAEERDVSDSELHREIINDFLERNNEKVELQKKEQKLKERKKEKRFEIKELQNDVEREQLELEQISEQLGHVQEKLDNFEERKEQQYQQHLDELEQILTEQNRDIHIEMPQVERAAEVADKSKSDVLDNLKERVDEVWHDCISYSFNRYRGGR